MSMIRKILGMASFIPALAMAANVITYTATSKISQKDADKKALEGAAMQISSSVKASVETHLTEDKDGNVQSTFESKKSVTSNVLLKGAKISTSKQDGVFQSTVTVDLEQLASKILLDLNQSRDQMKSLDSIIRLDMIDRNYRKMASDMVLLEKKVDDYEELLENLSYFQPISGSLKLESTLGELTEFLMSSMSTIKMDASMTKNALVVTVSDFAGPITNFPVVLTQEKKNLASEKTNGKGVASFPLKTVMKNMPSGEVVVLPDMNFRFVRQSALVTKTVSYQSAKTGCKYRLACDGGVAECGALQSFLMETGLNISSNSGWPELSATMNFSDKPNSAKSLFTSRATIVLKYGKTEMVEQPQGVGKDEESAHMKAISKMPATKILNTFAAKGCKK